VKGGGLASLSRAMLLGFVRDRAAHIFSILLPVLFLVLFGSIYKNSAVPKISLIAVGHVQLLHQAEQADPGQTKAGLANSVLGSIVQAANQAASTRPPKYTLAASQVEDKSLKAIQYVTPGLLGWALASGATFGAAITLVSCRQNKLLRRLRLAPVHTSSIVAARIGISVAIGLIQLAVFLAIATLPYFGLRLTASWWMAIPLVVAGILAFLSIGLLVGAVAKTQQAASSIANLVIVPMAFLGGAFIPLDFAPAWIRQVSYAMPLRYLVTGMQDVMARGEGPASALPAIGILVGFTALVVAIAVRVFRWDDV
jgi:ABC-2 type transport system permease protein